MEQHRLGGPSIVVRTLRSGTLMVVLLRMWLRLSTVRPRFRFGLELTVAGLAKCVFHRKKLRGRRRRLGLMSMDLNATMFQ